MGRGRAGIWRLASSYPLRKEGWCWVSLWLFGDTTVEKQSDSTLRAPNFKRVKFPQITRLPSILRRKQHQELKRGLILASVLLPDPMGGQQPLRAEQSPPRLDFTQKSQRTDRAGSESGSRGHKVFNAGVHNSEIH